MTVEDEICSIVERAVLNFKTGRYGWSRGSSFRDKDKFATSADSSVHYVDIMGAFHMAETELKPSFKRYGTRYLRFDQLFFLVFQDTSIRMNDNATSMDEVIVFMERAIAKIDMLSILDIMDS